WVVRWFLCCRLRLSALQPPNHLTTQPPNDWLAPVARNRYDGTNLSREEAVMHNGGGNALAVFIDFENLALGFQGRRDRFNIERVLERLVEKGKIVAKKAYCDWSRFANFTAPLHEAAIELIEIPRRNQTGKNSADIRLCVDA